MRFLEGLQPEKVFYFFEEICSIPHGSGNTRQISNYLAGFAKERNLEHYQDRLGNVIMIKEATKGYENRPAVMIQGHMDMVAVKKLENPIDMEKEGLHLCVSGDKIYARGTSLGGDDGIAVAYGLALLDGDTYRHPRLELVITVDEEVGMDGAREIDLSCCKATTMINVDSEEEGIFLAGCAGGARVNYSLSYNETKQTGLGCRIRIWGLTGGHSGVEIHKERGNANCLLGRVLNRLYDKHPFFLVSMEGGFADNAIPREAYAELLFADSADTDEDKKLILQFTSDIQAELRSELAGKDADICVSVDFFDMKSKEAADRQITEKLLTFLTLIPNGVQAMSGTMDGLVETSLNPGILDCREGKLHIGISVRSSYESAKKALIDRLKALGALVGAETEVTGDYPGWAYSPHSPLRHKMIALYKEMYGTEPEIQAIHAGLECGLFAGKIPGLDCVSMGPDMKNIHTTEEELSIASAKRVWEFLIRLLEEMK